MRFREAIRQFARDLYEARVDFFRNCAALLVVDLALLPWLATVLIHRDVNVWVPLAEIGGVIFIYWFFTRRQPVKLLSVNRPITESALALILVAIWMLYRLAEYAQLIVVPNVSTGFCDDFVDTIIPKMVEMVILPLAIFLALHYTLKKLGLSFPLRAWIPALIPLLAFLDWGLTHQTPDGFAMRTVCFYLGAGLPEELLFRGMLQSRFEILFKQPVVAIFLGAFVFGASHLPIDLHNAGIEHWQDAVINAFTFQMGIGLALGYAFQRARNLWPLTLLHALIDSAPLVLSGACGHL